MRSTILFALLVSTLAVIGVAADETLLISADKIYTAPDSAPLMNGTVLIRGGRIARVADERARIAIPKGTQTSDCRGVVVAGFQNSHVHFMEPRFRDAAHLPAAELARGLEDMLTRWGFTTAFDTASDQANTFALRARVNRGEVRGPRILTTGLPLFPVDGIPVYIRDLPADELARMHQPKDAAEARKDVRGNFSAGADATKIFLVTPQSWDRSASLTLDVARAAAEQTHASGKLLLAHPTNLAGIRTGLDAGVDVFVHTTLGEKTPWDDALVRRMVDQRVSVIPTFKLWYYELAKENVPANVADTLVDATFDELRAFRKAGGQVLFGTDVGYMHDYDPTDEYVLMAKAGMSPMEILASLTTAPAARWNEAKARGRVSPGFAADLVVLAADPAQDVKNFANVRCVFRGGERIYSSVAN
jgi:imidazolonepropionase-like amidohydrolase